MREEADETDAFAGRGNLGRGEAVAVLIDPGAEFIHLGVRLGTVAAEREEFHDALVGVDAMEKFAVPVFPVAQDQAFGAHGFHWTNSSWR